MSVIASQITSVSIVYLGVCSDTDQRKHQSSVSLAFVRGIHPRPVNSPHKGPVTRKMFSFDDVIMTLFRAVLCYVTYVAEPLFNISQYLGMRFASEWPRGRHHSYNDDSTLTRHGIFTTPVCHHWFTQPRFIKTLSHQHKMAVYISDACKRVRAPEQLRHKLVFLKSNKRMEVLA